MPVEASLSFKKELLRASRAQRISETRKKQDSSPVVSDGDGDDLDGDDDDHDTTALMTLATVSTPLTFV